MPEEIQTPENPITTAQKLGGLSMSFKDIDSLIIRTCDNSAQLQALFPKTPNDIKRRILPAIHEFNDEEMSAQLADKEWFTVYPPREEEPIWTIHSWRMDFDWIKQEWYEYLLFRESVNTEWSLLACKIRLDETWANTISSEL